MRENWSELVRTSTGTGREGTGKGATPGKGIPAYSQPVHTRSFRVQSDPTGLSLGSLRKKKNAIELCRQVLQRNSHFPQTFSQCTCFSKRERKKWRGNLGLRLFALLGPFFCSKFKKKKKATHVVSPKCLLMTSVTKLNPWKAPSWPFTALQGTTVGSQSPVTTKTSRPF